MTSTKFMSFRTATACIAALTLSLTSPAFAQSTSENAGPSTEVVQAQFVEDTGGGQRINNAGKLRMLSQRIPAAACTLNAGIAIDDSRAVLEGALAEYERILAALVHGDDEMGIYGPEERVRTLRIIQEIHSEKAKIEPILAATLDGTSSAADIQTLAQTSGTLLDLAKMLTTEITGSYSLPVSMRQADALAIDIAGRQRMLTQKLSKEVCQVMSGIDASSSRQNANGTAEVFETTLNALRNGMPAVGLEKPANDEIADGLEGVMANWMAVKSHIDATDAGEALSDQARADLFLGLNKTMAEMNRVVGLYSENSKTDL